MFQLTTLLISFITAAAAQGVSAPSVALAAENTSTASTVAMVQTVDALPHISEVAGVSASEATVEAQVRAYFADIPELAEVARCESGFRHTDKNGKIVRGLANTDDVGVMQINEYYHADSAKRLGYNINTLNGNMAFARHLYEVYGTDAWKASSKCWKKPVAAILAERK